jgi:hypothetical protein
LIHFTSSYRATSSLPRTKIPFAKGREKKKLAGRQTKNNKTRVEKIKDLHSPNVKVWDCTASHRIAMHPHRIAQRAPHSPIQTIHDASALSAKRSQRASACLPLVAKPSAGGGPPSKTNNKKQEWKNRLGN